MSAEERESLLQNLTYVEVLLSLVLGYEYPTAIAKLLKKKQPTITEELSVLKHAGLVTLGERTKAQRYVVNWDLLLEELRKFVFDILKGRNEFDSTRLMERVKKRGFYRVFPSDLFKAFLREYYEFLTDAGGLIKDYNDICLGFFKVLADLDQKRWKKVVREYQIDAKLLGELSSFVATEIHLIETAALRDFIDTELPSKKTKTVESRALRRNPLARAESSKKVA
jgi:hypothetical protein